MPKGKTPTQGSSQAYNPNSIYEAVTDYGSQSVPVGGTASPYQQPGAGTDLLNALGNYNNQAMESLPVGGAVSPYQQFKPPTTPKLPTFAQVSEDDASLDDFAARHGADLQNIVSLNNTKSLPPKGSYLQLIAQGVPPSVASSIAGGGLQQPRSNPNTNRNRYESGLAQSRIYQQANQIMQQWQTTGQDPVSIPASALQFIKNANGEPLTIQAALQMGYVMNEKGILVKSGSPGAPGAVSSNNYTTNDALYQITWGKNAKNRKNRFQTNLKWAKNAWRRKAGKGKNQRPVAAAPIGATSTEGPTSILDIHLGSG